MNNRNYFTKHVPSNEDIVVAKFNNITENGIYGRCVTYPDYEVFLLATEITKKKKKVNVTKMFSPDVNYAVVVINVNPEKKVIDVSYSKVNESDQKDTISRQAFYEKIYGIGNDIIKMYKKNTADGSYNDAECDALFKYIVQVPLDVLEADKASAETAKDQLLTYLEDPQTLFQLFNSEYLPSVDPSRVSFFDNLEHEFIQSIKKRVKISDVTICCDIVLCVIENSAVDVIKGILTVTTDDDSVMKIEHLASPKYRIVITNKRLNSARTTMDKICSKIKGNAELYKDKVTLTVPENYTVMKDKEWSLSNYNI